MSVDKSSFTIIVTASPFEGSYHQTAIEFCHAVLRANHLISQVFFYGDGCLVANRALADDASHTSWCELNKEHQIPLNLCVSTAQKRGILDVSNAAYLKREPATVAPAFSVVGLAQFFNGDANEPIMIFKGK